MRRAVFQVVVLGDSISWSTHVPFGRRYGDYLEQVLQARLGPRSAVDVAICGDGGNTTGQGLARAARDVVAYAPHRVLVNLGCNNLTHEPDWVERDLRALLRMLRARCPAAGIVLETIPAVIEARHGHRALPEVVKAGGLVRMVESGPHRIIRRLARAWRLPLHDRWRLFQAAAKRRPAVVDTWILPDGIHLTAAGNRHFAASAAALLAAGWAACPPASDLDRLTPALWLARAETTPAFLECCRALRDGGLALFLRTSGSWSRLMLQQTRSFARRAAAQTTHPRVRDRAARTAAMAAAFSALQHALPSQAHDPIPPNKRADLAWARARLREAPPDSLIRLLQRRLRAHTSTW